MIQLCESALKKGLDKSNTAFANDLMASAYVQRGSLAAAKVYQAIQEAGAQAVTDEKLADVPHQGPGGFGKGKKLGPEQPQAHFEIAKLNLLPGGDPHARRCKP